MPAPAAVLTTEPAHRDHGPTLRPARRRLGLAPGAFVVLHCGRLAPRGGIDTIILGVALLKRRHGVQATLLVVDDAGAPPAPGQPAPPAGLERARLRQLARELGIERQVHFLAPDHADTVRDCYAASDVLVSMPWDAQSGSATQAAMAWTRSVIAAAAGSGTSRAGNGDDAWPIAPRDAEALAHHLARLQRRPDGARAMASAGRARVPA